MPSQSKVMARAKRSVTFHLPPGSAGRRKLLHLVSNAARRRVLLHVRGIVQGVGFRPFVFSLAKRLAIAGTVRNTSYGVLIDAEGERGAVERFIDALDKEAPPLAWIQEKEIEELAPAGGGEFIIERSSAQTGESALVSPDVATCPACIADITESANGRRGYAFTNCTNCGPRYTIVRDIPYDRCHTTMSSFAMCRACQAEYDDPADRRFHAQPNACPDCGPSLSASVEEARRRLARGESVAIQGLGGFHLACDARNAETVHRLRARKRRSEKPFALMARDGEAAAAVCEVSDGEREALISPRCPIVLLAAREPAEWQHIAPGIRTLGVMLPYTPLYHLLFEDAPYSLLVMTSGNLSEEPIVVANEEAARRLSGIADWILTHDREIHMRTDDSIVRVFEGRERLLRRSRGYVPRPIAFEHDGPQLLAVGGELKSAFCLTKGRHAILSQHIGDLENYETLCFFEETLANLKKLFRVEPQLVAHDLHPAYLSTRFAFQCGLPAVGVQHHHAHIASCMAEHRLGGEVIGVAFDGTGYGTDGAIWGGEFLVAGYRGFERLAHIHYVELAGGDAAIRQPWRAALAWYPGISRGLEGVPEGQIRAVRSMMEKEIHTFRTSSCGRLFDAVASLTGLRQQVSFEGQAAIELEQLSAPGAWPPYYFQLEGNGEWEVDFRDTMAEIAVSNEPRAIIAARFHATLAHAITETCRRIRRATGLERVCLSGGTFQNMRLLSETLPLLHADAFEVYLHEAVPPNDGGMALGQAAIAAAL